MPKVATVRKLSTRSMTLKTMCLQETKDGTLCTKKMKHKGRHVHNAVIAKRFNIYPEKIGIRELADANRTIKAKPLPKCGVKMQNSRGHVRLCGKPTGHKGGHRAGNVTLKVKPAKPVALRVPGKRVQRMTRIESFLVLLSRLYPQDVLKPGIVLAHVGRPDGAFYASVVRYEFGKATTANGATFTEEKKAAQKQVLYKAIGRTTTEAIDRCIVDWEKQTGIKVE